MSGLLSIIIPTYKRKESLERLLKTLLAQESVHPEIIVVDQNPSGFLDAILAGLDGVERLVLDRPNASDARNKGYLRASGDYLLFIDDDLLPEADFCKTALDVFSKNSSIGCFSPLVYSVSGKELAMAQANSKRVDTLEGDSRIFRITDTISAALFFRRDYYRQTGGFDPMLFDFARTAEDQEFFLRMRKKELGLYFVPFVEVFHDEDVPGGCDLRTAEYWITREKCMKSWAYRYRIHNEVPGILSLPDGFRLMRSAFLNKEGLLSGPSMLLRQVKVLIQSIKASRVFLKERLTNYVSARDMDHLSEGVKMERSE